MEDDLASHFEFEFRDYLAILRRRVWTVVIAVAVVLGSVLVLSLRQEKIYSAVGILLVGRLDATTPPDLKTEIRVLESAEVRKIAVQKLPGVGDVRGSLGGSSRIIAVSLASPDPLVAAGGVDAYIDAYGEYRQAKAEERLQESTQQTQGKIDELQKEIDRLTQELDDRRREVDSKFIPVQGEGATQALIRQADANRARLAVEEQVKPRLNSLLSQQISLEQLRRELVANSQRAGERPTVLTPPTAPTRPVKPTPFKDGILAGGAGLVLGIALALLFEYLDDSIKTKEDVRRAIGDAVPVAAIIPSFPGVKRSDVPDVISLSAPRSPVAEAYRALRTSVQFLDIEEPLGALAITSAVSSEGKTTTLANLAVLMAGTGRRVIVLDCDLRRPRIHECFGLSNEIGFTSVLIGAAPLSTAIQRVPGTRNLALLSSGPLPPNPSELLSSRRFKELVLSLRADDSLLLVDTPPLLPVTDAAIIATSMDQVLLVSSTGRSTRKQLRQAVDILRQVEAPLTGIVLNRADAERKGYSYGYHYHEKASPSPGPGQEGSAGKGNRPKEDDRAARQAAGT